VAAQIIRPWRAEKERNLDEREEKELTMARKDGQVGWVSDEEGRVLRRSADAREEGGVSRERAVAVAGSPRVRAEQGTDAVRRRF
jgi:hypothetical protein